MSYEVENYPGFVKGMSGFELMEAFKQQAARFGARFRSINLDGIEADKDHYVLMTALEDATVTTNENLCGAGILTSTVCMIPKK